MYRGTWAVKGEEGVPFLYFSHLARLAEEHFGYKGITPVQHGHGGWTAAQALKVVDKEVVDEAGPNDLVILQFGGNDLSWANVQEWNTLAPLTAQVPRYDCARRSPSRPGQ